MIPGPANILSCPHCGGEKEVMSIVSGNTCGGTVWSDTRRDYPMLPEVSPIQQCSGCGKYYFIEQAESRYSEDRESMMRSFGKLGKLSFLQLMEAKRQMETSSLTKMERWVLNHQIFMAYNDTFRRNPATVVCSPAAEEKATYDAAIHELLDGIDSSKDYELFHAELLREIGKFDEAAAILQGHDVKEDKWVVDAMMRHISAGDTGPFLLIECGEQVGS